MEPRRSLSPSCRTLSALVASIALVLSPLSPLEVVLGQLGLGGIATAHAQDDTYRRLAEDATRAMTEHRLEDALTIFREMHAMQPSARTLWSLGRVHHELGRYVLAMGYLDEALRDPRRPLDEAQRQQASELRARAEALTGILELRVEPAEATVLVDDVELDATSSPSVIGRATRLVFENGVSRSHVTLELRLDVGDHVIRVERAGRAPSVRRVPVQPGARARIEIADTVEGVADPALAIDRGGLGVRTLEAPSPDVRVVVTLAPDTQGPLHVSLQPLGQMGTLPMGEPSPLCDAPCDVRHVRGLFGVSITRDGTQIVNGAGALGLATDTHVMLRYHDETSTRIAGWIGTGLMVAYGLVATALGAVALGIDRDDAFREVIAQDGAVALIGTGIPFAVVGLIGLVFALQPDWVEVGQMQL